MWKKKNIEKVETKYVKEKFAFILQEDQFQPLLLNLYRKWKNEITKNKVLFPDRIQGGLFLKYKIILCFFNIMTLKIKRI